MLLNETQFVKKKAIKKDFAWEKSRKSDYPIQFNFFLSWRNVVIQVLSQIKKNFKVLPKVFNF